MRRRPLPTIPTALLALVLLGGGVLTGCSSDDPESPDDGSAASAEPSTSGSPAEGAVSPGADPNSPFVVAASAVATRSRDQVTQLHAMGVGTTSTGELPKSEIPGLAQAITTELAAQIQAATAMTPPEGSPAAQLVAALTSYRALSRDLAKWKPDTGPLPEQWFDRLQRTDDDWKASLGALGELSGEDLLADLPPLLMPA